MIGWLTRWLCGWRPQGHEFVARFEGRETFHECLRCGLRSHGIVIEGTPRKRFDGDPGRHRLQTQGGAAVSSSGS